MIIEISDFRSLDNSDIIPLELLLRSIFSIEFIEDEDGLCENICQQLGLKGFYLESVIKNILNRVHTHFFVEMMELGFYLKNPVLTRIEKEVIYVEYG